MSLLGKERQIETSKVYHYTSTRITQIKKTGHFYHWQGCGLTGTHMLLVGIQNNSTANLENGNGLGWAQWLMPVIPDFGRLRWADHLRSRVQDLKTIRVNMVKAFLH